MGRNSKLHHQHKDTQAQANELLNFHFSTPAASRQDVNNNNNNRNARRGNGRKTHQNNSHRHRSAQDRASARRKADSTMFYLHSSSEHTFLLTRRSPSKMNETSYSFHGSNESVSWGSVRMVQHRVPQYHPHNSTSFDCPICLCDFVCPRISKCGHSFCLPCILRHVQTYSLNNPYHPVKCPCCGIPFIDEDLRPVIMESVRPVKLKGTIRLRKLHRQKESSAPFLPTPDAPQHYNPHFAPTNGIDADAKYSRFNYVDPGLYHTSLVTNQEELTREIKIVVGSGGDRESTAEMLYLSMALEIVLGELEKAKEELSEEKKLIKRFASSNSGMYQKQSPALMYEGKNVNSGIHLSSLLTPEELTDAVNQDHFLPTSLSHDGNDIDYGDDDTKIESSPVAAYQQRYRGDSVGSHKSIDTTLTSCSTYQHNLDEAINANGNVLATRKSKKIHGSMYLDTLNAVHFYQAENGQLVFLNGFNMKCLLSDFSKSQISARDGIDEESAGKNEGKHPEINRTNQAPPLPDFIEGRVLEIENVNLTPESRKRMPFLNHIPLYTDIVFVELDLHHLLCEATRRKFKGDFSRRRKRRQSKIKAESRADHVSQKEEEQRINERKARLRTIDPDDEFFQVESAVSEPQPIIDIVQDFGPLPGPNNRSNRQDGEANENNDSLSQEIVSSEPSLTPIPTSSFSFSEACRRGNDHVTLSSAVALPALSSSEAFPSLGSSCSKLSSSRGPYLSKQQIEEIPQTLDDPATVHNTPGKGKKKKKKAKNLVLFSTGGSRGY